MESKNYNVGRFCCLCLICLVLSGCIKYVYVPVSVCPISNIPKKQELKTKNISDQVDSKEILRALAYDIIYLEGYTSQLLLLLEGYNSKDQPNPKQ